MFSSMEIGGATDVAVDDRRPVRGGCGPLAIAVGLQDRADRGVGARTDLKRAGAGGLKPLSPVALGQPQDADAGAKALLGVVFSVRMSSTSVAVLRPISPACRLRRSGVQS